MDIDIFPQDYRELITEEFENVFYETRENYLKSKEMREIGTKFNKFSQRLIKATKKSRTSV